MNKKTRSRKRYVTRTIELLNTSVIAVDLDAKAVKTFDVQIAASANTPAAQEAAVNEAVKAFGNYKAVSYTTGSSAYRKYALEEAYFLAHATLIATGNSPDNLTKVTATNSDLDEIEEEPATEEASDEA